MKAIEQYFHVVLFIMLYKVVLTLKSVDETLLCENSNEQYFHVCTIIILCCTRWCYHGGNSASDYSHESYVDVIFQCLGHFWFRI